MAEMTLNIPQWRCYQIKDVVFNILNRSKTENLSIDLHVIMKTFGMLHVTFEIAETHGIKLEGTDDGCTIARPTPTGIQYMIVYNDAVPVRQWIPWTIAHEIGHIDGRSIDGYLEAEANYFAPYCCHTDGGQNKAQSDCGCPRWISFNTLQSTKVIQKFVITIFEQ